MSDSESSPASRYYVVRDSSGAIRIRTRTDVQDVETTNCATTTVNVSTSNASDAPKTILPPNFIVIKNPSGVKPKFLKNAPKPAQTAPKFVKLAPEIVKIPPKPRKNDAQPSTNFISLQTLLDSPVTRSKAKTNLLMEEQKKKIQVKLPKPKPKQPLPLPPIPKRNYITFKKWDDTWPVEKLPGNQVLTPDGTILSDIYYNSYIREEDVPLVLDVLDERYCLNAQPRPLPTPLKSTKCKQNFCRLGCVCESIKTDEPVDNNRDHCGKPECLFECSCSNIGQGQASRRRGFNPSLYENIRSRLRPRVGIFNWQFLTSAYADKNIPAQLSYRKFDATPQKPKVEIKTPAMKKFFPPANVQVLPQIPPQPKKARKQSLQVRKLPPKPDPREIPLPYIIKKMQQDGQLLFMGDGDEQLCFLTYTTEIKHPRAVLYEKASPSDIEVTWLYLPIPPHQEIWLFHPINTKLLQETQYINIPEINCFIPSEALSYRISSCLKEHKTVRLELLWIGVDSKKRGGSIYILPNLHNTLICGPFPHDQFQYKDSTNAVDRTIDTAKHLDVTGRSLFMGNAQCWDTWKRKRMLHTNAQLTANIERERMLCADEALIPECVLMPPPEDEREIYINGDTVVDDFQNAQKPAAAPSSSTQVIPLIPLEESPDFNNFYVTWQDAVKVLNDPNTAFKILKLSSSLSHQGFTLQSKH